MVLVWPMGHIGLNKVTHIRMSLIMHTHTNAGNTMNTYKQRQQRRIDIGILMVLVTTLVLTLGVIV